MYMKMEGGIYGEEEGERKRGKRETWDRMKTTVKRIGTSRVIHSRSFLLLLSFSFLSFFLFFPPIPIRLAAAPPAPPIYTHVEGPCRPLQPSDQPQGTEMIGKCFCCCFVTLSSTYKPHLALLSFFLEVCLLLFFCRFHEVNIFHFSIV